MKLIAAVLGSGIVLAGVLAILFGIVVLVAHAITQWGYLGFLGCILIVLWAFVAAVVYTEM